VRVCQYGRVCDGVCVQDCDVLLVTLTLSMLSYISFVCASLSLSFLMVVSLVYTLFVSLSVCVSRSLHISFSYSSLSVSCVLVGNIV